MRWMNCFVFQRLLPVVAISALIGFPGCRAAPRTPLFSASGPGWRVEEGQALWRPGRRYPELGGEIVVARDEVGRCTIQFAKTPLPLVLAQTTRTNWQIEFPPRRMRFGGPQPAPTRFAWLYLPAALSGQPLPSVFHFETKSEGGWRLENLKSGESVEGFLAP